MRRGKVFGKVITFALGMLLVMGSVPTVATASESKMTVNQAKQKNYLITYRAGNVGKFDPDQYRNHHPSVILVDASEYYITCIVSEGGEYPALPTVIDQELLLNEGYLVSDWGPKQDVVTASAEYVVDYSKMINPITYHVSYQTEDGRELTTYDGKGNVGETVNIAKLISGYRVADGENTYFVLSENRDDNQFVVHYVSDTAAFGGTTVIDQQGGEVVTVYDDGTQIVYVPGTISTDDTENVTFTNVPATIGNQTVQISQSPAVTQSVEQAMQMGRTIATGVGGVMTTARLQGGNDEGGVSIVRNQNTQTIEDETVALGGNTDQITETTVEIVEPATPKGAVIETLTRNVVLIVIPVVVLAAAIFGFVFYRKKRNISKES